MNTETFELELKREFLVEALELIEGVEAQFIEFERKPEDRRIIDQIFRLAHTLKGSAMTAGFVKLGEFAHAFETLLAKVRSKEIEATRPIIDLLLNSTDFVASYVRDLQGDMSCERDATELKAELSEAIGVVGEGGAGSGMSFGFFEDEGASTFTPSSTSTSTLTPTSASAMVGVERPSVLFVGGAGGLLDGAVERVNWVERGNAREAMALIVSSRVDLVVVMDDAAAVAELSAQAKWLEVLALGPIRGGEEARVGQQVADLAYRSWDIARTAQAAMEAYVAAQELVDGERSEKLEAALEVMRTRAWAMLERRRA